MESGQNITLNAESKILIGFLALVGAGFLVMVIALMRSSDVAVEPAPPSDINSLVVERSIESTRNYNKPLAVHAFTLPLEREVSPDGPSGHEQLMPGDLPDNRWSSKPLEQSRMVQVQQTMADKKTAEEDEEMDQARTGWGWLADDIMSSRKPDGPGGKKNADSRKDLGKTDELPDDEGDGDESRDASGKDDRDRPGKSSLMGMDEGRDSLLRPLYDFDKSGREDRGRDERSSRDERADAERNPSDNDQAYEDDEYDEQQQPSGMDARDPFARNTEEERPVFGSRDWRFGESDSSVFRSREGVAADSSGSFSSRIVGDAASDASRLTSAWSGYASDSVFSGGGGYTPSGVSASGSEALFSGAGVFGGGVGSSVINPVESTSGGISPLGGSSIGGLPSGSSSIGGGSFGEDRSTPSALPW